MVGEMLPDERNRVTLADEKDQHGLRVAKVTYSWGDNDKALIGHALDQMQTSLQAVGARDIFRQENDTNHLAGTRSHGGGSAHQRGESRLPKLGYSQFMGVRRIDFSHYGRCQSLADNYEYRDADGGPQSNPGEARGA
jgi:hypothetical protein